MRISTQAAGFVAMGFFVIACGDGTSSSASSGAGGGSGGDAAAAVIDMYCNTIPASFCSAEYACCSAPPLGLLGGLDACEEAVRSGLLDFCAHRGDQSWLEAPLRTGAIVFDQARFDTCLTLLKSMSGGGAACVEPPEYVFFTTCLGAFRGQIAPGDACDFPADLWMHAWHYSGLPCKDGNCENGKCAPFLKPGDACQIGLYGPPASENCNSLNKEACKGAPGAGTGPTGTCGPQGDIGDECHPGNDHECKSLYCDATGKCAPAALHDPCEGV